MVVWVVVVSKVVNENSSWCVIGMVGFFFGLLFLVLSLELKNLLLKDFIVCRFILFFL